MGNLKRACRQASAGKRQLASVAKFLIHEESKLFELQTRLVTRTYRPGKLTQFVITDPKERVISAAPFRDRVVHHALINILEPVLEKRMISNSFACRKGKGTHAAIKRAQRFVKSNDFFLKMDVAKCFASFDHSVVLAALARIVKDRQVLWLCEQIVTKTGLKTGLPIGNLTSQWFANLTLTQLDRHIKQRLRVKAYLRYMDDFVCFSDSKAQLKERLQEIRLKLAQMKLKFKERSIRLAPCRTGLNFLGRQIFANVIRVAAKNFKRCRGRILQRHWQFQNGQITSKQLLDSDRSIYAHLSTCSTKEIRSHWCISKPGQS